VSGGPGAFEPTRRAGTRPEANSLECCLAVEWSDTRGCGATSIPVQSRDGRLAATVVHFAVARREPRRSRHLLPAAWWDTQQANLGIAPALSPKRQEKSDGPGNRQAVRLGRGALSSDLADSAGRIQSMRGTSEGVNRNKPKGPKHRSGLSRVATTPQGTVPKLAGQQDISSVPGWVRGPHWLRSGMANAVEGRRPL
jgi:hypothetical protein